MMSYLLFSFVDVLTGPLCIAAKIIKTAITNTPTFTTVVLFTSIVLILNNPLLSVT